jgi:hypothetical protein
MKTTDSENLKDEVKTNEQREPALTHKRADLETLADEVEHAAKRGDFERAEQKRRELKKALDQHERGPRLQYSVATITSPSLITLKDSRLQGDSTRSAWSSKAARSWTSTGYFAIEELISLFFAPRR